MVNSVTYRTSNETSQLANPLSQTTVGNEQTVSGQLAYEIPASSPIPDTPLVYTGQGGFKITWTNAW